MPTGRQAAILGQSVWTPVQLGSALVGWWDASYGVTQSGGLVSDWADRIGGYDAAQSSGSLKPIYSATSMGGRPGLTFDGVDDVMSLVGVPASFPTGSAPGWIFALVSQDAAGSVAGITSAMAYGVAATNTNRRLGRTTASSTNRLAISDGATSLTGATNDLSGINAALATFSGAALGARANGTDETGVAATSNTSTTRLRIGAAVGTSAANFWTGVLSHILVGTGTLTLADEQKLEAWALWSCGQQAKLPAAHPYANRRP